MLVAKLIDIITHAVGKSDAFGAGQAFKTASQLLVAAWYAMDDSSRARFETDPEVQAVLCFGEESDLADPNTTTADVVPLRAPPPAGNFLDEAAELAGYAQGETHRWASEVLAREANRLKHGAPAFVRQTQEELAQKNMLLRAHIIEQYTHSYIHSHKLIPSRAADVARLLVEAIERGEAELPKTDLIVPGR